MKILDLDANERLVLVAALGYVIGNDAHVSEGEHAVVQRVATALGDDAYRTTAAECGRRFRDEQELLMFAPVIHRPAARELIYETAVEAALPDAIDARESGFLQQLAKTWHLHVSFAPPSGTR